MEEELHRRFLNEIAPAVRKAVSWLVNPVGSEDRRELIQDGIAMAWKDSVALALRGRELVPGQIVFYVVRRLRSGRRSCGSGRTDVMSPGCVLDGNSRLIPVPPDLAGDEISLAAPLADQPGSPDIVTLTRLDLEALLSTLSDRQRFVLAQTINGCGPAEIATHLGLSPPRVVQIRRSIGEKIRAFWGDTASSALCLLTHSEVPQLMTTTPDAIQGFPGLDGTGHSTRRSRKDQHS